MQGEIKSKVIAKILKSAPNRRKRLIERFTDTEVKEEKEKKRKVLNYDKEGKWSQDLIIEKLKQVAEEYGKLTWSLLRRLREEDPENYPAPSTVQYRIGGSWKNVCKAVGGDANPLYIRALGDSIEENICYFLDLYHRFGVRTRELYLEARRKYPEYVPSYNSFLKIFGTFTAFRKLAKIDSCSEQINRLVELIEELNGRWPRRAQCKERNIDIVFLDKRLGGRKELRALIADLRSIKDKTIEK